METPTTTRPGYSPAYTGAPAVAPPPSIALEALLAAAGVLGTQDLRQLHTFLGKLIQAEVIASDLYIDGFEKDVIRRALSVRVAYAFGEWPPAGADR